MRLRLPLPPPINACHRAVIKGDKAVVLRSKAYREWLRDCEGWLALAEGTKVETGDVRVSLVAVFKDRRRDLDSVVKPTLDALQGVAYSNDKQVDVLHIKRMVDKADPHVDIMVWSL